MERCGVLIKVAWWSGRWSWRDVVYGSCCILVVEQ